jgi:transposase-like protein
LLRVNIMGIKETQLTERIVAQAKHLAEHKKKPTSSRRVKHNRYTDEDKAAALAHLQSKRGAATETAREMRVPVSTLKDWASGRYLPPVLEKYGVVRDALAARLEEVAHRIIDVLPEKIEAAPVRDLSATLGLIIDKMRLLREEPTAITEATPSAREMLERLIERTMHHFPGMSREEVIEAISQVRPEAIKLLY